ncbi:MAG: hypothetical protein GEU28_06225 [Dehalococcoidia bacterium]|nr:hypothetical protein [Dehalococcoidia bacterium]
MPRTEVALDAASLRIRINGIDRWLALKRGIEIPLRHIRSVRVDSGVLKGFKGIRFPGTHWSNAVVAGTFYVRRPPLLKMSRTFWTWRRGQTPLVVETDDDFAYQRVVIGFEDPQEAEDLASRLQTFAGAQA